jgi:hypothetical protein
VSHGPGPGDGAPLPVQIRTRFERFPATVKGAFVMQGADGNPHGVRLEWAAVARIPSGPVLRFPVEAVHIDVAPSRDLFVPFEAPISDLEPSWYVVRSRIQVDGGRAYEYDGRPFAIPWPRGDVRRGVVRMGTTVGVSGASVLMDRVEMGGDSCLVVWRPLGEEEAPTPSLLADGRSLEPLPAMAPTGRGQAAAAAAAASGERRNAFYPVPRAVRSLVVVLRLASGDGSEPMDVPL